jgi:predicted SprT family Zn-dependent metalloprotease
MNLNEAENLAISLMRYHGLYELGWRFEFDNAKRRFGVCRYRNKTIGLSKGLTALNELERVRNTILHEIAHALVGPKHGHDWVWRRKAIEIGCDGKRCYSSETTNTVESRYIAICPKCKHTHKRHKITSRTKTSSCGKCSPTYDEKYKLNWVLNPNN